MPVLSRKSLLGAALLFLSACGLLFLFPSMAPSVRAQVTPGCSVASVSGSYALLSDGWVQFEDTPPKPGGFIPAAIFGAFTYDGAGNVSGRDTVSIGGTILRGNLAGTYVVNSDCTGTATLLRNGFKQVRWDFMVVDSGREIRGNNTDAGDVGTFTQRK